jgi:hypothetical protein
MRSRPQNDLAARFWAYLCRKAGLPPALSQKAWRALRHTQEVTTWRFTLAQALEVESAASPLKTTARPQVVVGALEECVRRKQLSRKDVNRIEEALFTLIRQGQWK